MSQPPAQLTSGCDSVRDETNTPKKGYLAKPTIPYFFQRSRRDPSNEPPGGSSQNIHPQASWGVEEGGGGARKRLLLEQTTTPAATRPNTQSQTIRWGQSKRLRDVPAPNSLANESVRENTGEGGRERTLRGWTETKKKRACLHPSSLPRLLFVSSVTLHSLSLDVTLLPHPEHLPGAPEGQVPLGQEKPVAGCPDGLQPLGGVAGDVRPVKKDAVGGLPLFLWHFLVTKHNARLRVEDGYAFRGGGGTGAMRRYRVGSPAVGPRDLFCLTTIQPSSQPA